MPELIVPELAHANQMGEIARVSDAAEASKHRRIHQLDTVPVGAAEFGAFASISTFPGGVGEVIDGWVEGNDQHRTLTVQRGRQHLRLWFMNVELSIS